MLLLMFFRLKLFYTKTTTKKKGQCVGGGSVSFGEGKSPLQISQPFGEEGTRGVGKEGNYGSADGNKVITVFTKVLLASKFTKDRLIGSLVKWNC